MSHLTAGIVLAVLSVTANATGMVFEKMATRRLPSIHARQGLRMVSTLARDPLWALGFALLVVGLGTQVLALTLAPIDIVQAVAACGISLFLVLSHFVLRERLSKFEYVGIAAILLSLLLLALSVDPHDDLVTSATSTTKIFTYAVPAVIFAVVLFVFTDRIRVKSLRTAHLKAPLFGISSGLLYGVAGLGVKEVSTIVKQHGLVDGVPQALVSPWPYLLLGSTLMGFLVFQTALQRTTASVFVPVNTVTSSCYFIIAGTVLFHERLPSAAGPLALRIGAFVLILVGLSILAVSKSIVSVETVRPEPEGTREPRVAAVDSVQEEVGKQKVAAASNASVRLMLKEFSTTGIEAPLSNGGLMAGTYIPSWRLSEADPHPGLVDPALVRDRLAQAQLRRRRHGGEVLVCRVALDSMSTIHFDFGSNVAKRALRDASRRLLSLLRTEDTVGRLGEYKLVVVLTVKHEDNVDPVLRRLQYGLDEPVILGGTIVRLQPSLGVAIAEDCESADEVLARADRSTRVGRRLNPVGGGSRAQLPSSVSGRNP